MARLPFDHTIMAEVAKRQRDQSSTPEPEAKRPNVDADDQAKHSKKEDDSSSPVFDKTTKKMSSDTPAKPMSEERDAVDLGSVPADATSSSDNKADNSVVSNGQDGDQGAGSAGSVGDSSETQATQISMRTLIVTSDASIIIGKSGKHINEIRDKSNARLNIVSRRRLAAASARSPRFWKIFRILTLILLTIAQSEIIPGNPERILTVSGPLDAVSKVSRRPLHT